MRPLAAARFRDRTEAGQVLARKLLHLREAAPIVLAIPGGGVHVAVEIASALAADLDLLVVQPIQAVATTETIGLLVEGGAVTLDADGLRQRPDDLAHAVAAARRELRRRAVRYRAGRPQPDVSGRTVILVDDGIATGRVMRAALAARQNLRAGRLVVAVPVAPTLVASALRREADEIVCAVLDPTLASIADSYDDFHPLAESEILGALAHGRAEVMSHPMVVVSDVTLETSRGQVEASLTMPRSARGIVVVPCADPVERHRARTVIRSLADDSLGFLVIDCAGDVPSFAGVLSATRDATWSCGLPLGLLALGALGRDIVDAVAQGTSAPSFCLADDGAAPEASVYFRACFARGLISV